jgi:hypothetical protein
MSPDHWLPLPPCADLGDRQSDGHPGRGRKGFYFRLNAQSISRGGVEDFLASLRKARAFQRVLRSCITQSELPPFLN